jgi:hypothetical protein
LNPPAGTKAFLEVTSPVATASVRGTSFYFDTRNIQVYSGTVAFTGKWGYQVMVQEGFTSGIGTSGTAAAAQNPDNSGFVSQPGAGHDDTAGTTGGSGAIGSGPTTGGVEIPITW